MWGLPPDAQVDYEAALAAVHPEDRARLEAAIARCSDAAGDGVYAVAYRVIGIGDGVERWIASRGQTSFDDGKPVGFLGVALDITERKHTEQQLRESESRLAAILEQLPVGVGLFDCEGRIQQSNKVLRRFVSDRIPSRDPGAATRWRDFQADGSLLPASGYPGARRSAEKRSSLASISFTPQRLARRPGCASAPRPFAPETAGSRVP